MTDQSLPRRITIDVPLRGTLIAAAVIAALVAVVGSIWWLNSVAPLQSGESGTAYVHLAPGTPTVDSGTVFTWKRDGAYQVQLWFHNTSSLPVTITGADNTGPGWEGAFTGPTLNRSADGIEATLPFHPVHVSSDGQTLLGFTFHANPRACLNPSSSGPAGWTSTDAVTVHFEQVPGFPQTQTISLGDTRFGMTSPTKRACAQ